MWLLFFHFTNDFLPDIPIAKALLRARRGMRLLPDDVIESLCLECSREFYDNANSGNYNFGDMKLAYDWWELYIFLIRIRSWTPVVFRLLLLHRLFRKSANLSKRRAESVLIIFNLLPAFPFFLSKYVSPKIVSASSLESYPAMKRLTNILKLCSTSCENSAFTTIY